MKVRNKIKIINYVLYPLGGFFLFIVAVLIHWSLIFLIIPWVLILLKIMYSIRSPNCNKPVHEPSASIIGAFSSKPDSIYEKRCKHCNHPFI